MAPQVPESRSPVLVEGRAVGGELQALGGRLESLLEPPLLRQRNGQVRPEVEVALVNLETPAQDRLGLFVSAFAFLFALYILIEALVFGIDAPGFPTLIISVMFFAGVQLISLGVIGEYLGRVYEEVKGRPLFVVAHEIGLGGDSDARVMERRTSRP